MSATVPPPLSRRGALLAATVPATAALTGCGTGRTSQAAAGIGTTSADLSLLRRASFEEERVRAQARRASRRHRALRSELGGLVAVHSDHLELLARSLDGQRAAPSPGPAVARDPRAAARDLARSERSLAETHARAALEARSGPFARVLAAMAAAADQQARRLDGLTLGGARP